MSNTVISIENLSKAYRLGQIGTGTLSRDINVWWAKARGKPNPMLKIGEKEHGNRDGETIWALKDVNFTVERGKALGIIGRNGAGKSTLLKILSRVTAPTSGHARVKGRIASLLEVGTGFHPDLTGRENIYLNGAILGMTKQEVRRKLDEIVAFAEIAQFLDTPVKRYSSGMYVRLAFAVAAHLDPEILVVDEVLAVGDAGFQKKCLGKMGDVTKEGRTVLFVSHNMGAIQNLCSRVLLFDRGELALTGETRNVVDHYLKTSYQDQTIDLNNCRRSGSGDLHVTSFHLESLDGQKQMSAVSGEPVIFVIGYENYSKTLRKVSVGFSIHTSNEVSLSIYYSHYSNFYFDDLSPHGEFRCMIPEFPFSPGNYLVGFRVIANGIELDWPKAFIPLTVVMEDFYGVGNFNNFVVNSGQILLKGIWNSSK